MIIFYFWMNQLHHVKDPYSSIAFFLFFLLSRYCKVFSSAISWHGGTELTRYTVVDMTLNEKIWKISIQINLKTYKPHIKCFMSNESYLFTLKLNSL